jgi:hypothetical protein
VVIPVIQHHRAEHRDARDSEQFSVALHETPGLGNVTWQPPPAEMGGQLANWT